MAYTAGQQAALEFLDAFTVSDDPVAVLEGYAGVGKTYVFSAWAHSFIQRSQHAKLCIAAPTHKALDVLRAKCGQIDAEFRTVASLLGVHISRNEDGELTKGESAREWDYTHIAVDEASMVSREDCAKLVQRFKKIVFVGDPAQLPPVGEQHSPAFEFKNKYLMTEVVRQQADNPVVGIATMLRDRISVGASYSLSDIGSFASAADRRLTKVSRARCYDWAERAIAAGLNGRILSYTNAAVLSHNKVMHDRLFPGTPLFGMGERVLLNNAYALPKVGEEEPELLTNGMEFIVEECTLRPMEEHGVATFDVKLRWLKADVRGDYRTITLPVALYEQTAKEVHKQLTEKIWALRKKLGKTDADRIQLKNLLRIRKPLNYLAPMRHAYSCTVHKSQGSTYDVAYVDWGDVYRSEDRTRLMYVAATRTSDYLVIVEG